ncbi:adenosylmethionine decarboxylase [Candidatus Woesearchaeota archaeon]|nr:adenosylmethionine decarboxylase [Candidatus Woesearchaeota archaeon]
MRPKGSQVIAEFINCSDRKLLDDFEGIQEILKKGAEEAGLHITDIRGRKFDPIGATVVAVVTESHIGIHTFPEANHASIDIYTCTPDFDRPLRLLEYLEKKFKPKTTRKMEIIRGNPIDINSSDWITAFSSYGFETRYHVNKRIFCRQSEFQKIEIIENEEFGKMLFLDNDLQVSERDEHLFNDIMTSPLSGSNLRKIAVLGGGDGGLLHHALMLDPEEITIIEIDKEVIQASKDCLNSISKGAFDDPKVTVIIDDVRNYLKDHKKEFDAVIYDLTMHPEAVTTDERKRYLDLLFSEISSSMEKDAVITMHCCGEYDKETLKFLKRMLPKYFSDIVFRTEFIPSFCERWIFASAKRK